MKFVGPNPLASDGGEHGHGAVSLGAHPVDRGQDGRCRRHEVGVQYLTAAAGERWVMASSPSTPRATTARSRSRTGRRSPRRPLTEPAVSSASYALSLIHISPSP